MGDRESKKRNKLPRLLVLLALGAVVTFWVAWGLGLLIDPTQAAATESAIAFDRGIWAVKVSSRWGFTLVESSRDAQSRDWGAEQVLGGPDTAGAGDIVTAWASASQDNEIEWLALSYHDAVRPARVEVHETHNPGALFRVSVFRDDGSELTVWEGQDPTPIGAGRGVSKIPVDIDFDVSRIKIYLDSPAVKGWNEIDAVGLVDTDGNTQWAHGVEASSDYANRRATPTGSPEKLIPRWSGLDKPTESFRSGTIRQEGRGAVGLGWPFIAVSCAYEISSIPGQPIANVQWGFGPIDVVNPPGQPIVLPFRPVWPGFLLDSAIFGVSLWVALLCLVRPLRAMRELRRMRLGQCLVCGYDLRYDFVRGCPECGWRRLGRA